MSGSKGQVLAWRIGLLSRALHQSSSCLWGTQLRGKTKSPGTLCGYREDRVWRKVKVEAAVVGDTVGLHSKKHNHVVKSYMWHCFNSPTRLSPTFFFLFMIKKESEAKN